MPKLCMIYNMAASYRAPIFRLIDRTFDVDWHYGYQLGDIKEMDASELRHVSRTGRKSFGPLTWQTNVIGLLWHPEYEAYIMTGEPFTLSSWAFCILKRLFRPRKKVYYWSHGWYGREGWFKKWLKRGFFGLADGTFLYGSYAREKAVEQGNNPDKLWVIHNSLDYDRHMQLRRSLSVSDIYKKHFHNDSPTLIFIGRLTPVKRLDLVIKALGLLKNEGMHYNLVFVGDGSETGKLRELADAEDVNVWFYGSCYDDAATASLIYNADLCVSPGNVGLTAIHTMSFGTPVLTHDNFPMQMPEFEAVCDGKTGAFFKENDVRSLADSITRWFADHDDREKVRQSCYAEIDASWTPEYQLEVLKTIIPK